MSFFTKTSSYYLKVLSPYVSLEEKEVVFHSQIDNIHLSSFYSSKLFMKSLISTKRKTLNKRCLPLALPLALPFNEFLSNFSQSSTRFAHSYTFSPRKVSTKAKLIFEMNRSMGYTKATKENVKRKETPRIACSFKTRQRFYKRARPLLSISRFDIQNLCLLWRLPIYPDRSNKQFVQSRNRIRKQLLPLVRFYLNPQIEAVLFQFTEILNEEHSYLERLAYFLIDEDFFPSSSFDSHTTLKSKVSYTIDLIFQKEENCDLKKLKYSNAFSLLSLPIILRRRILKSYLENLTGKSPNFFYIERLLSLLKELVN